uniref:Uncharacterized protein n=1 Tax=Rhizophora mucronata TaxID=61149 RepID=A0A2P2IJ31_RHIMU
MCFAFEQQSLIWFICCSWMMIILLLHTFELLFLSFKSYYYDTKCAIYIVAYMA